MRKRSEVVGTQVIGELRSKTVVAKDGMRTGTSCPKCRCPQTMTSSGPACENGHGMTHGLDRDGNLVDVERDPIPAHPVHQEQYGAKVYGNVGEMIGKVVGGPSRDAGATVTVGRGEWLVQPVQYNSFRVAAVSITTTVRDDETLDQAARRAFDTATQIQMANAEVELKEYLDFLERVGAEVGRRR